MKRILIIKLGALGDVVMATPLVDAIVRHHEGEALTVLTTPPFGALFANWPAIEVVARPRAGLRNALGLIRWLRREAFDRIYDLQSNDRSRLWCALAGARERVGNHNHFPYTHHPADAWRGQCHIFARQCAVLSAAGIEHVEAVPTLPRSTDDVAAVDSWCHAHGLASGRFVVCHAGASARRTNKIWPHYAAFATRILAHGLNVVWLGAALDQERNAVLARSGGIDATAAFSVTQLAILGSRARFALTNDSGPMHVLSASGIPVFALFGPSDWRRNHALGQATRVLAGADYRSGPGDGLANIKVDDVWARLSAEALI